jgi:hypothetical protein
MNDNRLYILERVYSGAIVEFIARNDENAIRRSIERLVDEFGTVKALNWQFVGLTERGKEEWVIFFQNQSGIVGSLTTERDAR